MDRLTLAQAAACCGLHPDTLRQAVLRGRLRAEKIGRDWTTTTAELDAYLNSRHRGNFRTSKAAWLGRKGG